MTTPTPTRTTWPVRIIAGLLILTMSVLLISLTLSTWRLVFPRQPAPTYVCVYVTEQGATTITGSAPCPARGAR